VLGVKKDVGMERLKARTFTGLTDGDWTDFEKNTKHLLGGGKRSMILASFVRKFNETFLQQFEREAQLDQRVHHAMNDALTFYNVNPIPYRKVSPCMNHSSDHSDTR
jgi:hypothetical protein